MPKVTERELANILEIHRQEALGYYTDEIVNQQNTNLERYQGFPYGDEQQGRSSVVSEDAAQVVDWTLPDLLEPFVSGDKVVEFGPQQPEDEEAAKQATDYVNFIFWKDNPGFTILYNAAKDGLIQLFGVTKCVWQEKHHTKEDRAEGINIARLQELKADDTVTITEQSSTDLTKQDAASMEALTNEQLLELAQAYPDGKTYDVTFEREVNRSFVELMPVPPEEFRISPRQAVLELSPYVAHECLKTRAELLELGLPEDLVNDLPPFAEGATWTRDDQVRFWNEQRASGTTSTTPDPSQDKIRLLEEYLLIDIDGDGETERVQVFRVNDEILSQEVVDEQPFEGFCPIPMPHKVIGESLVDKVKQTQRIKTVLTRQLLDNVYAATNPQREVPEDAVTNDGSTYDDLLTFRVGGLVRTKKPNLLREMAIQDRSGVALQAIGYFDTVRDMETGAVRGSAGMSSEALDTTQAITAEEARRTSRSQLKRTRMMARVFAETYLMPLMGKIYRLVVKYQDFERIIRLRGKFVSMDPRTWNADMDVECNVGLGYPNREEKVVASDMVLGKQVQALPMGLSTKEKIYNTLEVQTEAAGMGDAEKYFVDPTSEEGQKIAQAMAQQPQPEDPALAKAKADAQLKAMSQQQDAQLNQAKAAQDAQLSQQKAQQDAQLKFMEIQRKSQLEALKLRQQSELALMKIQAQSAADQEQAQAQLSLDIEKAQADHDLETERMNREFLLAIERLKFEQDMATAKAGNGMTADFREGGNLAQ